MIKILFVVFIAVIEDLLHLFAAFEEIVLLTCDLLPPCCCINSNLLIARDY